MTNLKSAKTILRISRYSQAGKRKKKRFKIWVKSPKNQTFTVDWGDGDVCRYGGSNKRILLSHDYASPDTFVITIRGVITMLCCSILNERTFRVSSCNLRGNPHIEALECRGKLMLQNNYALKELFRFAVGIGGIDLAQLPALECIEFMDSFYKGALDFSNNPKLKYLGCPCNDGITALDVSRCPDLEYIDICYAERCRLNLEHNHKLKYLFAWGIKEENIRLPEGRTVIVDHQYEIPEQYWTILGDCWK